MNYSINLMEENDLTLRLRSLMELVTSSLLGRHADVSMPWFTILQYEDWSYPEFTTRSTQSLPLASVKAIGASSLLLKRFISLSTSFTSYQFDREVILCQECQQNTLQLEIIVFHLKMKKFPLYKGLQMSDSVGRAGKPCPLLVTDLEEIPLLYEPQPRFDSYLFSLAELEDSQDGGLADGKSIKSLMRMFHEFLPLLSKPQQEQ